MANRATSVVSLHDVWLTYASGRGAVEVLSGVDFSLAAGERACVVGPSGSGKSTLLMVLAGLHRPNRGRVHLRGKPWPANADDAARIRRSDFGLVFQEPFLLPYLTIRENALTAAFQTKTTAAGLEQKAEGLGIAHLLDERPARLSLGERQRGSILRALINEPKVIIADEPTANLDLARGLEVVRLLMENLRGASLILVTHDTRIIDDSFSVFCLESGVLKEE